MNLDEFLTTYEVDDNAWWFLHSGEHQALFDALLERYRTLEQSVKEPAAPVIKHNHQTLEQRLEILERNSRNDTSVIGWLAGENTNNWRRIDGLSDKVNALETRLDALTTR